MTLQGPGGRKNFLHDLTRWNRAGLSRIQYVDGDAAVWLEELRIALLGLYLRGVDVEDRYPENWRDIFMKQPAYRQLIGSPVEFENAVAWKDLLPTFPKTVEASGTRNERLLAQYDKQSFDYAWEIARAFSRAAHILLRHQNAYANEGYLRTATQWENLRKLASMVNYQPTPPASATTTVALEIEQDKGAIEVARGLAMNYAPPEGGPPLIFETLKPVQVHPDLNVVYSTGWNKNLDPIDFTKLTQWITPGKAELAQGDPVVVSNGLQMLATMLYKVDRNQEAEFAKLKFDPVPPNVYKKFNTLLFTEPEQVQVGLPKTTNSSTVVSLSGASSYQVGEVVKVIPKTAGESPFFAVVTKAEKGNLVLAGGTTIAGAVDILALTPVTAGADNLLRTAKGVTELHFKPSANTALEPVLKTREPSNDIKENYDGVTEIVAHVFEDFSGTTGPGYAELSVTVGGTTKTTTGTIVSDAEWANDAFDKSVRFEGKPPKTLRHGAWYVARPISTNTLSAHKVSGIRIEADVYYLQFCPNVQSIHDQTEFFGPMTRSLTPVDYNRDQRDAISGGVCFLENLSAEAQNLLKLGREIIILNKEAEPHRAGRSTITAVDPQAGSDGIVRLTFNSEDSFVGWKAGWTNFHLNTVDISHGGTKGPKILGSGDAEVRRQDFQFKNTGVSFIPSNASSTGVAPDMDVAVDGVKWEFRDIGDPTAEGNNAWSFILNEDDTLQIHFRRRLPSGTNNAGLMRIRVGVGARGTGIPAWSIEKPMKKNRFVTGIIQPFMTTGGADRELVSDIRENASSKLAANGRAVSLKDFERLCRRHSSVWQAKARQKVQPGAVSKVEIVIVPANGGLVGSTLKGDLIDFVTARSLPNVEIDIIDHQLIPVETRVTIHVDPSRYEKDDVKEAVENILLAEFSLKNRALEQPLYSAEILALSERVTGVSSAIIKKFTRKALFPIPLREAYMSESLAVIFPTNEQVVVLAGLPDVTVDVEVAG